MHSLNWRHKLDHPATPTQSETTSRLNTLVKLSQDHPIATTIEARPDIALQEQRRIYAGNLKYEVKPEDLAAFFAESKNQIENIQISIDTMTGRNPSYCFLDLQHASFVPAFIAKYDGKQLLNRAVKVRLGKEMKPPKPALSLPPKDTSLLIDRPNTRLPQPGFNRWKTFCPDNTTSTEPLSPLKEGTRLYVGGLPRFANHQIADSQIREIFQGINVLVVSKLLSPSEIQGGTNGCHQYCFVDVATPMDAEAAIASIHGQYRWNTRIRCSRATGKSGKLYERQRVYVGGFSTPDPLVGQEDVNFRNPAGSVGYSSAFLGIGGAAADSSAVALTSRSSSVSSFLSQLFSRYGPIQLVSPHLLLDDTTGSWYCLVQFSSGALADHAICDLDGTFVLGNTRLVLKHAEKTSKKYVER